MLSPSPLLWIQIICILLLLHFTPVCRLQGFWHQWFLATIHILFCQNYFHFILLCFSSGTDLPKKNQKKPSQLVPPSLSMCNKVSQISRHECSRKDRTKRDEPGWSNWPRRPRRTSLPAARGSAVAVGSTYGMPGYSHRTAAGGRRHPSCGKSCISENGQSLLMKVLEAVPVILL